MNISPSVRLWVTPAILQFGCLGWLGGDRSVRLMSG